jgi:hypothetical protein
LSSHSLSAPSVFFLPKNFLTKICKHFCCPKGRLHVQLKRGWPSVEAEKMLFGWPGVYQTHTRILTLHILISSLFTNYTVSFFNEKATIMAYETRDFVQNATTNPRTIPTLINSQTGKQPSFFRPLEWPMSKLFRYVDSIYSVLLLLHYVKTKAKQSHYRPGHTLRFPEG